MQPIGSIKLVLKEHSANLTSCQVGLVDFEDIFDFLVQHVEIGGDHQGGLRRIRFGVQSIGIEWINGPLDFGLKMLAVGYGQCPAIMLDLISMVFHRPIKKLVF